MYYQNYRLPQRKTVNPMLHTSALDWLRRGWDTVTARVQRAACPGITQQAKLALAGALDSVKEALGVGNRSAAEAAIRDAQQALVQNGVCPSVSALVGQELSKAANYVKQLPYVRELLKTSHAGPMPATFNPMIHTSQAFLNLFRRQKPKPQPKVETHEEIVRRIGWDPSK